MGSFQHKMTKRQQAARSGSPQLGFIIGVARGHQQERDMKNPVATMSVVGACLLILISALHSRLAVADDAIAEVLKPPAGQVLSLSARADGVQIYQCLAQKDEPVRFSWTLKGPEAVLRNNTGKPSGRHYAGPTWEANDGSKVMGELVAKADAPTADSIPWLLLKAKSTAGHGVFSEITSIQRLRTHGGIAPEAGCDRSQAGQEVRVPYSALYRFYTFGR
jgi:hypothetical protein